MKQDGLARRPRRAGTFPGGMQMRHLSGVDASFLHLETPEMPMHVGSLNIFDLPEGYTGDFY